MEPGSQIRTHTTNSYSLRIDDSRDTAANTELRRLNRGEEISKCDFFTIKQILYK